MVIFYHFQKHSHLGASENTLKMNIITCITCHLPSPISAARGWLADTTACGAITTLLLEMKGSVSSRLEEVVMLPA